MFDEIDNTEGKDMLIDLAPAGAAHVGCIVGYERPGWVSVEYNGCEPKEARLVAGLGREELTRAANNRSEALIVFEQGNPDRPIVLGLMETTEADLSNAEPDVKPPLDEAVTDGETVNIEGKEQIVLKCGKASITLTRSGKILIRGAYLLNRSSGVNRIKGGSVQIN
jgi:hypothetical protein